ncbi:MAG: LbtU family siderophore porin [Chromatiales bacterium]|nr:LbtU family siderophore porin [Chromatiales bacterium]
MKFKNGLISAAIATALSAPVYAADVNISGALEVEVSSGDNFAGGTTTDIVLATAAVGLEAEINNRISATVNFLYEEDDTPFGLDEGFIDMKLDEESTITMGRTFVPFGNYDSYMVSDPMTLEIGETSETAFIYQSVKNNLSGTIYLFNGDAERNVNIDPFTLELTNDDELDYGVDFTYSDREMSVGVSYISNIADSDGLSGATAGPYANVKSAVPGYALSVAYQSGRLGLRGQYVTADGELSNGDLGGAVVGNKVRPSAANGEVAYQMDNNMTVAASYQVISSTIAFTGLPKYITSVALSYQPIAGMDLGIEYASKEDHQMYGSNTADQFTINMAVEF